MVKKMVGKGARVVVLGAGFAGVACVQRLVKRLEILDDFQDGKVQIFLVDRNDYHLFQADLYEISTAYNNSLASLKEAICIPVKDLIDNRVKFIKSEIFAINPAERVVKLKDEDLAYDYLFVALGSETNYFGIEGMEKFSLNIKTLDDALEINESLNQFFVSVSSEASGSRRDIYMNVGGGGATGVETAAELTGLVKKLCKKYHYPIEKVRVSVIEGSSQLAGFGKKGTDLISSRLKDLGVKLYMENSVRKITKDKVFIESKKRVVSVIPSDIMIWTGGVQVNRVVQKCLGSPDCRGAVMVNEFLRSERDERVFAAGDNAFLRKELGMFAQVAYQEAWVAADNIAALVSGNRVLRKLPEFKVHYILPLGGRYAIWKAGGRIYKGFLVWLIRRFVFFRYALQILPFWKAVKKLWRGTVVFVKND